jgi:ankyrin repeat protein
MRPSPAAQKRDEYKNLPLNPRNHKKENLEFFSKNNSDAAAPQNPLQSNTDKTANERIKRYETKTSSSARERRIKDKILTSDISRLYCAHIIFFAQDIYKKNPNFVFSREALRDLLFLINYDHIENGYKEDCLRLDELKKITIHTPSADEFLDDIQPDFHRDIEKTKYTLLSSAAKRNCPKIIELLCHFYPDIDVNRADDHDMTPLYSGALCPAVVELLLDSCPNIDVNRAKNDHGMTPLLKAIVYNIVESVELLLKHPNIDVNKANNDGETPLLKAACFGLVEIVRELLAHPGIDVNKTDKDGKTPIDLAIEGENNDVVKLLRENKTK